MKYIYLVSMLVCMAVTAVCIAREMEVTENDRGNTYEGEKVEGLMSIKDIESLGCFPREGKGKYRKLAVPILGAIHTYSFNSNQGCTITVVNTILQVFDDDPGVWAGMRVRASQVARKRGFKKKHHEGNIGDYSEAYEYTLNGKPQGLYYIVQLDGLLASVLVVSEGNVES